MHFGFDDRIIFGSQVPRQQKVIVKPVSDLRTDGDLNIFFTENFHYRIRQDMCQRMSVDTRIIFLVLLFIHPKTPLIKKLPHSEAVFSVFLLLILPHN